MGEITARWSCYLWVECPLCEDEFDVLELEDAGDILRGINTLESHKEIDVQCPDCCKRITAITRS